MSKFVSGITTKLAQTTRYTRPRPTIRKILFTTKIFSEYFHSSALSSLTRKLTDVTHGNHIKREWDDFKKYILENNITKIRELLEQNPSAFKMIFNQNSMRGPLFTAAQEGNLEILELLLEKAEKAGELDRYVNSQDINGNTALHVAAGKGFTKFVTRLLKAGAHADITNYKNGETALHLAVLGKHSKLVSKLIESNTNLLYMNNNKLDSPLALIFKTNLSDVVEHLIEHNINLTDYVIFDSSGTYPLLCFLAYKNDFHTFQSLLEKDMIPKISLFFKDSANLSPVCYFIMQGNKKAVEYCIKEMIACDYQVFERHASELILYCAKHDETGKLTRIILDQIIVNQLVIKPAIEEALLYEKYKSLREMFKSHRNDFSTNQINGLMSLAMKHKDWEFCENLISNISTDYKDEHGNNFLHLAATYNATPEIIRVLKDRGVEYLRNEYNQKQYATPLKMALENKNLYTLIAIMTIYDRKISNEFANQSLCLAIKNGNLNDVKFFSPLVTPNFKDRNGDTALHHAAIKYNQSNQSEQHLEIYKYLLECGYKEDIKNHNGKTPHWLANYRGDMLFSSKILEQTTNKSGHSR